MPASQSTLDRLQQLGLTSNEAEVYGALVESSPSFVAPLVTATGKHRQMVYNALDGLIKRNLIAKSIKNGKFYYEISTPDRLVQMIKEQESVAHDLANYLAEQIKQPDEQVEVLKGSRAYQEALLGLTDIAQVTGEYIIFKTVPNEFISFTADRLRQHIKRLRDLKKAGVAPRLLAFPSVADQLQSDAFKTFLGDPYETRLSGSQIEPPQTVWISGDHVYLRNYLDDPILIHIVSADLAARYRQNFFEYWDAAKPVKQKNTPAGLLRPR